MTQTDTIAIAGVAGRMGRQLTAAARGAGLTVTGGTEAPGSAYFSDDIGTLAGLSRPLGIGPVTAPEVAAWDAGVWVDFTAPAVTLAALNALVQTKVRAIIIGTTGFDAEGEAAIAAAAQRFAIVKSGNFSLGVNLMLALVKQAAARLSDGWDIEILETHHRNKIDAPSGTALMLGQAAAQGRGAPLETLRAAPYDGPDAARKAGEIGFSVRRSGGVIGQHTVSFGSMLETLSLTHEALDRSVFASGAIAAAKWALQQPPGLYDMTDVLGL